MAYDGSEQQSISIQYQVLVLRKVDQMLDAHAAKDKWKYFSYFRAAHDLLQRHLDLADLQALEVDWKLLRSEIDRIGADKNLDEAVRKKRTEDIQESFADAHRFYIYKAFPKAGIIRPEAEGVMDFTKHDIEQVKTIIRAGASKSDVDHAAEVALDSVDVQGDAAEEAQEGDVG